MSSLTPSMAAEEIRGGWTGSKDGPIKTVELLTANGGYFEVPHLLMTYVEYLAGLHSGKGPDVKYTDVRAFFDAYFPGAYQHAGAWLIFQYRHGLVHTFAPKVIKLEDGTEVGWHCDLGEEGTENHLRVLPREGSRHFNLRVHGIQFLVDFGRAAERFADDIEKGVKAFDRFKAGRDAYDKATPVAEIKKRYVSDADKSWLRESTRSQ